MTKSDELDDTMRVLSTGTCDTLSGSSKLTYHIGMHAGRRDLSARAQQHRRRVLLSGVDLAAGHPDGTEEASGRKAHHVHPAESALPGQVGQHAGVPDGGAAARESGAFDAGEAPETRADGPSAFKAKVDKLMASGTNAKSKSSAKTRQKAPKKKAASPSSARRPDRSRESFPRVSRKSNAIVQET